MAISLPLLDVGMKLIDRLLPDPKAASEAKLKMLEMQQAGDMAQLNAELQLSLGQIEVNKAEAASGNSFASSWRPFIGWTCGAAFAYKFVLAPFVVLVLDAMGIHLVLPVLDFTEMSTVLLGMLGLGGMRTLEKVRGVA